MQYLWSDAWLLQSITLASGEGPATLGDVIGAADAVNHAMPTADELHGAFVRLTAAGFVAETNARFELTQLVPEAVSAKIRASGWYEGRRAASKFLNAEAWSPAKNVRDSRNAVRYDGLTPERIHQAESEYRLRARGYAPPRRGGT